MFRRGIFTSVALALVFALAGGGAGSARAAKACTPEQGQEYIDEGRYEAAIREFTCLIEAQPTEVEGYRGRIEAELLLGRYSDAVRDYTRVTAYVIPVYPDAQKTIMGGYADRLAIAPSAVPALTGASFAEWYFFDYGSARHLLSQLLAVEPDDIYGNLFQGSSRLLSGASGANRTKGVADLERAIAFAPESPDVRFIVADAYAYGLSDLERAFAEASLALDGGLDTPRVHAILAASYTAFGDLHASGFHTQRHFELVTTELIATAPIAPGSSLSLDLMPGRAYEIPVEAVAGQMLSITTSSHDYWDTILVLLAPDGTPVLGADDVNAYFAAFDWVAEETGTYRMWVTFFESVNSGELVVARD